MDLIKLQLKLKKRIKRFNRLTGVIRKTQRKLTLYSQSEGKEKQIANLIRSLKWCTEAIAGLKIGIKRTKEKIKTLALEEEKRKEKIDFCKKMSMNRN